MDRTTSDILGEYKSGPEPFNMVNIHVQAETHILYVFLVQGVQYTGCQGELILVSSSLVIAYLCLVNLHMVK